MLTAQGICCRPACGTSGRSGPRSAAPYYNFFLERYTPAYRAELDHFITAIEHGIAPSPGFADGRAALVLADAANESLRTGATVKVRWDVTVRWGMLSTAGIGRVVAATPTAQRSGPDSPTPCGRPATTPAVDRERGLHPGPARVRHAGRRHPAPGALPLGCGPHRALGTIGAMSRVLVSWRWSPTGDPDHSTSWAALSRQPPGTNARLGSLDRSASAFEETTDVRPHRITASRTRAQRRSRATRSLAAPADVPGPDR